MLANLHDELAKLVEKKKWSTKAACHIACLDIDAEQLWVLRFYKENRILPTIKQAEEIREVHDRKKLTVKKFKDIMSSRLNPKWLVFHYDDIMQFFEDNIAPDDMRKDVLNILSKWKNGVSRYSEEDMESDELLMAVIAFDSTLLDIMEEEGF